MIIVEGPDGAGKTQLVLRLADDLGVEVAPKVVQPDMTSEVDLLDWCKREMMTWPQKRLYDRFPLVSEFIYGPMYRHDVRAPFKDLDQLKAAWDNFKATDPLVIVCLPPLSEVLQNVNRSDTDNSAVNGPQMSGVYWQYHNFAAGTYSLVWDYTNPFSYEPMLQNIKRISYRRNYLEY